MALIRGQSGEQNSGIRFTRNWVIIAVGSRVNVLELLYHEALRGRPSGPCTSLIVCDTKMGRPDFRKPGGRSPATSRSRSDTAFHDASKLWRRGASVVSDEVARPLGFILVRRSDLKQHGRPLRASGSPGQDSRSCIELSRENYYRCVKDHYEQLETVWDERYQRRIVI